MQRRTFRLVAASVAAAVLTGLLAVPAFAPSGKAEAASTPAALADLALKDRIVGVLAADYRTRGADVSVAVVSGRVTLSGRVSPQVHTLVDELLYSLLDDVPVPVPNLNAALGLSLPRLDLPVSLAAVRAGVAVPGLSQILDDLGVLDLLYDSLP